MKMKILATKVAVCCGNEKFFRLKNEKIEIYGSKNPQSIQNIRSFYRVIFGQKREIFDENDDFAS